MISTSTNGYPVATTDVQSLPAIRLGMEVDAIGLPTQTGPTARPKQSPEDLPAQFRVITTHTIEAPPVGRRGRIIQPEYDFGEVAKAIDTDGLLSRACQAHINCVMKAGWSLVGRNDRSKAYVQSRLDDITFMSQQSFAQLLRQAAQDLVCFHNFFVYLVRDSSRSAGQPITFHGKRKEPVAALHPMDPTSLYPVLGDTVEIRKWVQYTDGRTVSGRWVPLETELTKNSKTYPTEDVLHGWYFRRTGFIFGTPQATPVLDDIRALRRLEEIAELIAHKHAFPLIHLKVGTESLPAKRLGDGTHEVDAMTKKYQQLPLEGAIVTSERVEIEAIKVDPLDLSKLLKHYEERAITGLGISDIDVGRGDSSNRGTAVVTSRALLDRCREYQQVLSDVFTLGIFDVLLMEGGFALTPENRVFLGFAEVDVDQRNTVENHALVMYQGGLLTETEARLNMGRDPITDAMRADMHFKRLDEPLAIIKAIDEPYTNAAKATAASRNQPTNQAGTKPAKTTPVNVKVRGDALDTLYHDLRRCIEARQTTTPEVRAKALTDCLQHFQIQLRSQLTTSLTADLRSGLNTYTSQNSRDRRDLNPMAISQIDTCLQTPLDTLFHPKTGAVADLFQTLVSVPMMPTIVVAAFFQTLEGQWSRTQDRLRLVAQRLGYCQAAWTDGSTVVWTWEDASCRHQCPKSDLLISPAQVSYHGLLGCACRSGLRCLSQSDNAETA